MINQINSISFQGKFTTKMQGRNGILNDIPEVFSRKTNGFNGSLELLRGKDSLLIDFNNKQKTIEFNDYGDLTGEYIENKTPETVEQIAERLANFFKVLKAQDTYNKVIKKLKRSQVKAESALNANKKTCLQAQMNGNKKIENLCLDIIEKNNKKLEEINSSFKQTEPRFFNFIKKLAGEDSKAQEYVRNITND